MIRNLLPVPTPSWFRDSSLKQHPHTVTLCCRHDRFSTQAQTDCTNALDVWRHEQGSPTPVTCCVSWNPSFSWKFYEHFMKEKVTLHEMNDLRFMDFFRNRTLVHVTDSARPIHYSTSDNRLAYTHRKHKPHCVDLCNTMVRERTFFFWPYFFLFSISSVLSQLI
jgi:hypothetical protein